MGNKYLDIAMETKSTLDSLETIKQDEIKAIQSRQDSTAYADSLRLAEIEQKITEIEAKSAIKSGSFLK